MMLGKRFLILSVLFLCVGSFSSGIAAQPRQIAAYQVLDPASALTTNRFYSPQSPGPFDVGRTTISYIDESRSNREVVTDIWYPVTAGTDADSSTYDLVFAQLESPAAVSGEPAADGNFPLIVFSHGSQGIRFQSFFLTEILASHGFIVAAPDHAGNTAADLVFGTTAPFEQVVIDRPLDVSFVIDQVLADDVDIASLLYGLVDESRIGVLGHSFGGYTTLAVASGAGTEVPADPRVDALAPFAPASSLLSDGQLQSITQPTLILGGSADITTPFDNQSTRPFELMTSSERRLVDIIDAGHQSFTNICDFSDSLLDAGIPDTLIGFLLGNADEGCAPELINIDEAHRLTRLYMVAFFQRYLNNDHRYDTYLDPVFADGKLLPVIVNSDAP